MSSNYKYKLSVITICRNAEKYIASAFESVRMQEDKSFEYLVIDGSSDDRTVDIIKQNLDIIDDWSSEPDTGIADAMNKGVAKSNGEYIVFLHADDYFVDEYSICRALLSLEKNTDLVAFSIFFESSRGRRISKTRGFNFYTNFKMPFYHPGVLCRSVLFDALSGFDTGFKIAMDYDFFLRAYAGGATLSIEQGVLTVFRNTGVSSSENRENMLRRFGEERKAHFKNCRSNTQWLLYKMWWYFYPKYKKIQFHRNWKR